MERDVFFVANDLVEVTDTVPGRCNLLDFSVFRQPGRGASQAGTGTGGFHND